MSDSPRLEADVSPGKSPENEEKPTEDEMMSREEVENIVGYDFDVKEQDRWLPIANVARIMKGALPDNAKISKDAKECMQECVSEFISFITSEASEKCHQEKRKTVNGEDIIFAMTSLGFENYSEALKIYLSRYRETLVARGDQKPATSGASAPPTTSPPYDSTSGMIAPTMESAESTTDFNYSGNVTGGEY